MLCMHVIGDWCTFDSQQKLLKRVQWYWLPLRWVCLIIALLYIYIYIYIVCIVCDTLPMFIVHQILFVLVISLNFNLVKVKNRSYSQRII